MVIQFDKMTEKTKRRELMLYQAQVLTEHFEFLKENHVINPDTGREFRDAEEYLSSSYEREERTRFVLEGAKLLA